MQIKRFTTSLKRKSYSLGYSGLNRSRIQSDNIIRHLNRKLTTKDKFKKKI